MKKIFMFFACWMVLNGAILPSTGAAAIYLNNSSDPGNVMRVNSDGSGLSTIVVGSNPYTAGRAIDVNGSLGTLYFSRVSPTQGWTQTSTLSGTNITSIFPSPDYQFPQIYDIATNQLNGDVYYLDRDGEIFRTDSAGQNAIRIRASDGTRIDGITYDPLGNRLLYNRFEVTSGPVRTLAIWAVTPDGSSSTRLVEIGQTEELFGGGSAAALEFDPTTGDIYFSSRELMRIGVVRAIGNIVATIYSASEFNDFWGPMALDSNLNQLYLTAPESGVNGQLWSLDIQNGATRTIIGTTNFAPSYGLYGIAIGPSAQSNEVSEPSVWTLLLVALGNAGIVARRCNARRCRSLSYRKRHVGSNIVEARYQLKD